MRTGLLLIVAITVLSFLFTDVRSPSLWRSSLLPLVTFGSLTALGLWVVAWLFKRRVEGSDEWMPDLDGGTDIEAGDEIDLDHPDPRP